MARDDREMEQSGVGRRVTTGKANRVGCGGVTSDHREREQSGMWWGDKRPQGKGTVWDVVG